VPARPTDYPDTPGFGFPLRFIVEGSGNAEFTSAQLIADHTAADFKIREMRLSVSRSLAPRTTPSPSPRPSPKGEGVTQSAAERSWTPSISGYADPSSPLPKGEGRGEGEEADELQTRPLRAPYASSA